MAHRDRDVLDAARRAADGVNALLDRKRARRMLHARQLRDSVQAISGNISEAFGRAPGRDRDYRLEIARGEAEETIQHLSSNFRSGRISAKEYWPIHNLLTVIVKMLNSMLA